MKFDFKILFIFLIAAVATYIFAYFRGADIAKAFGKGLQNFLVVIPLVFLCFLTVSILLQLIPEASLLKWVGSQSGFKGLALGSIVGCITPGHPVIDFPICLALLDKGAGIGVVIAILVSSRLWNLQVLTFELSILGWRVTLVRWLATLFFPILAGYIAQLIFGRWLGG